MKNYLMSVASFVGILLLLASQAKAQSIAIAGLSEQEATLINAVLSSQDPHTLHPERLGLPKLAEPMPRIYYPLRAEEYGIEGRVLVAFTVDTEGHARDVEVLQEPGYGCQDEVQRVVQLMQFKPIIDGEGAPVETRFLTSFDFRLD
ncbi:MAG: energy transducer TonB [Bacteroidetes bacterium]|nr:MAG: energy transducer TonB [Bacteroidota bacterium]